MAAPRIRASELKTRDGFVRALSDLKASSPLSYAKLSRQIGVPASTVHGWCRGLHLPYARETEHFTKLLTSLGVDQLDVWVDALVRLRGGEDVTAPVNPYRGLEPYTEDHADLFVGRDAEVDELLRALDRRSSGPNVPVVVIGASGSGKTSLLRAGLLPRLRDRGEDAFYHVPTSDLIGDLQLIDAEADDDARPTTVVLDQLELMLSSDRIDTDAAMWQLDRLLRLGVKIVVAVRADFFEDASAEPALLDGIQYDPIIVTAPRGRSVADVILQPAERVGLDVDAELVARLTRTFDDEPTHGHVALPLLSHVLQQLADAPERNRLTVEAYERLGGLHHAISQAAEETYQRLDAGEQAACARLFVLLVELGTRSAPVRRHFDLRDLEQFADQAADADAPAERSPTASPRKPRPTRSDIDSVIDRFVDRHVLTIDRERLSISHDRLLSAWPRLAGWIDEERSDYLIARRIGIAAEAWRESEFSPESLLGGFLLGEAMILLERNHLRLSAIERSFVDQSAAHRSAQTSAAREITSRQLAMQAELIAERSIADQLAVLGFETAPTPEARSAVLHALQSGPHTRRLGTPGQLVARVAPDGHRVAANSGSGHSVELFEVVDGVLERHAAITTPVAPVTDLAWSPDGRRLAIVGQRGEASIVEIDPSGRSTDIAAIPAAFSSALSGVEWISTALLMSAGPELRCWPDPVASQTSSAIGVFDADITRLAGVGDTSRNCVALAAADGSVHLGRLNFDEGVPMLESKWRHRQPGNASATAVALSADGRHIAAGWRTGKLRLWSQSKLGWRAEPFENTPFSAQITDLRWRPDGTQFAAASVDGTAAAWLFAAGTRIEPTRRHAGSVLSVDFTTDGLVTASEDGVVRSFPLPAEHVHGGAMSWVTTTGASRLATATHRNVAFWNSAPDASTALERSWSAAELGIDIAGALRTTRSGHHIAIATGDGHVAWLDSNQPSAPALRFTTNTGELIEDVAFVDGERQLVAGDRSGQLSMWPVTADESPDPGQFETAAAPPSDRLQLDAPILSVAADPEGSLIATTSESGQVAIAQVGAGGTLDLRSTWSPSGLAATCSVFHPTSPIVAIGDVGRSVTIWSLRTPSDPLLRQTMADAEGQISGLAFSADGHWLAAASTDGYVQLWSLGPDDEFEPWARLRYGPWGTSAVAFTQNDTVIVAVGAHAPLRAWTLDVDRAVQLVRHRSGDPLTELERQKFVPPILDGHI